MHINRPFDTQNTLSQSLKHITLTHLYYQVRKE